MIDPNSPEFYSAYRLNYGPGPFVTCDAVVTRGHPKASWWDILLINRKKNPFTERLALPGGFMEPDDYNVVYGAIRECEEETNLVLAPEWAESTTICDGIHRDPRARIIGIATYFQLPPGSFGNEIKAKDDAEKVDWYDVRTMLALGNINFAFDHGNTIKRFLQ